VSLEINTRMNGGVVIVDLIGRVTLGAETGQLRATVADLIKKGQTKLVLNLAELSYADSAGLGELVGAHTAVRGAGGALKLVKVGGRALELLQLTRLATLFEFFDNEPDAVKAFE
jgi:anti-sigma B factor antagonist